LTYIFVNRAGDPASFYAITSATDRERSGWTTCAVLGTRGR